MCRIVMTRQALKRWRQITQQDSLTERAYLFQQLKAVAKGWQGLRIAVYRAQCIKHISNL